MIRVRGVPFLLALAALATSACDGMPRDPERSLETARGGTLRVGVTDAPPWLERPRPGGPGAEPSGPEAELVRAFAASIGARVAWVPGPLDDLMERLERFELDLVAAGLTEGTAWQGRVGLSTPWLEEEGRPPRVLAVPPGENALLVALDRHILRADP